MQRISRPAPVRANRSEVGASGDALCARVLGSVPRAGLALVLCASLVSAACTSSDSGGGSGDSIRVDIKSPTADQVFVATGSTMDIPMVLTVQGLDLAADTIECTLDGAVVGTIGMDGRYTFLAVALGAHTLGARALNGDGTPRKETAASASVAITVTAGCASNADCNDSDPCTIDSCGSDDVCEFVADSSLPGCGGGEDTDGGGLQFPCKAGDDCGSLYPGDFAGLGDCVAVACNTAAGQCEAVPMTGDACDDGDPCTTDDLCDNGDCLAGATNTCDDDDACTDDMCDESGCTNEAKTCDDGNPCTIDDCDSDTGCTTETMACDDGDPCTVDSCDSATGDCVNTPMDCTGGNECQTGECDSATGECTLVNVEGACDDGDACTTGDVCTNGECLPESTVDCDDGDPCTGVEGCNPADGTCVQLTDDSCGDNTVQAACGETCDDGNTDNNDGCDSQCQIESAACVSDVLCSDGNPCTADTCDPEIGCQHAPLDGTDCDDGDACTSLSQCVDGECVGLDTLPNCQGSADICAIFGASGSTVSCPLRLARASQSDSGAAALQFKLAYDNDAAKFINFFDEICIAGVGCFPAAVAGQGASTMTTGHSVSIAPTSPDNWIGTGAVIIVNLSSPTVTITDAYYDGEALVGDSVFMEARFEMKQTILEANAAMLKLSDVVAAKASSQELACFMDDQSIICSD